MVVMKSAESKPAFDHVVPTFLQKNTPVQIWNLGIWDFVMVDRLADRTVCRCEALERQPRSGLAAFGSIFASAVGPPHSLKLGGPCQPLAIALPIKQKR